MTSSFEKTRKTECGAKQFSIPLVVRAAPFALWRTPHWRPGRAKQASGGATSSCARPKRFRTARWSRSFVALPAWPGSRLDGHPPLNVRNSRALASMDGRPASCGDGSRTGRGLRNTRLAHFRNWRRPAPLKTRSKLLISRDRPTASSSPLVGRRPMGTPSLSRFGSSFLNRARQQEVEAPLEKFRHAEARSASSGMMRSM